MHEYSVDKFLQRQKVFTGHKKHVMDEHKIGIDVKLISAETRTKF